MGDAGTDPAARRGRYALPVTKVAEVIRGKGVSVAGRGRGTPIGFAALRWETGVAHLTESTAAEGTDGPQRDALQACARLLRQGLETAAQYATHPVAADAFGRLEGRRFAVAYLERHEWLMDVEDTDHGDLRLCVDIDVAGTLEAEPEDAAVLYALGVVHEACHLGGDEERTALGKTLALYEGLSPDHQRAIRTALASAKIDNDGVFLRFLEDAAHQPETEQERLIAWTCARTQIELPYSGKAVRRVMVREREDLEALRTGIFNAINETYVPEVDTANCTRIADQCQERGQRLVGGRFSRAFYIDAMLMASSGVMPGRTLAEPIEAFERAIRGVSVVFESPQMDDASLDALGGEVQQILNLAGQESVSGAEIEGALEQFKKALRGFESAQLERLDALQRTQSATIARQRSEHGGRSRTWNQLTADRNAVKAKVDALMEAVSVIEGAAQQLPKADPAFMVFFQRLFPLDAINMGMVNELQDPFFGEDEQVHRLIRACGHNVYVTPNLQAWLRRCDDWIEALPAYASYEIVPQGDGGYRVRAWVQRAIMEDMYRRHAEDWALNIESVMASEHVALARELMAEHKGLEAQVAALARDRGLSREEAIRWVARREDWSNEIAGLGALIEATYERLCAQVAERRQQEDVGRTEALGGVIRESGDPQNLAGPVLKGASIAEAVAQHGLGQRAGALRPIALKRRRQLPCVHVLTTLGPGETEMNVRNWLEESMSLFNVSRGHDLEGEVARRIAAYQTRILAAGARIVEELDLQGDLYNLMQEEGLSEARRGDRDAGMLRLIASYPEVAAEAAKVALLADQEPNRRPDDVRDPACVRAHLDAHPELSVEAARQVVASSRLQAQVEDYRAKHGATHEEAAEAIVAASPVYEAERNALAVSKARQVVLESLGLAGAVRGYTRDRMDRMLATVRARREVIAELGLSEQLNHPRFRYDATGPFKEYHLLYTPSRVDLGAEEVHSVRNVPKWVGGLDREAARAGKALYKLYNVAGPTAVHPPRFAEFLKVGENFFSRGGVFYLSLAAGANLDALGMGDFEFFRDQWNMRGDRTVLPTGETYGGFCVPKEFSLLYAIIIAAVSPETSTEILNAFSVPQQIRPPLMGDLRRLLRIQLDAADAMDWEVQAAQFLSERYGEYFAALGGNGYVARLPQLAQALQMAGVLAAEEEREVTAAYQLAYWINKKAQGLEEINRVGPFRKVDLIRRLAKEARARNPHVVPDHKLIGVMGAPYKEGERKHGKEILITDVRFSAGARKLEIYAGAAEHHLLKDLDPEGREIIRRMLEGFRSPADIRMVGTCTGSDVLNHVPGSGLEAIKDDVMRMLTEAGLDEHTVDTNCTVYGGDLEQWSGIKELGEAEREALIGRIGPSIHLLVLDRRGTYRTYEEAIQGVDFVDLGIPDPELLDLVDDLPKMVALMRRGRPNSALVFADGTSGARRRTFSTRYASSKLKTKELFALDDDALYGAHGLGRQTIEEWRKEMVGERQAAQQLLTAVLGANRQGIERTLERIRRRVILEEQAEEAAKDQIAARQFGVDPTPYHLMAVGLGRVKRGLSLGDLDFGLWMLLGGRYVVSGKMSREDLARLRSDFERSPRGLRSDEEESAGDPGFVESVTETFFRPTYVPPAEGEYREVDTGISGSLKAAEEKVSRLEKRAARVRMARRAGNLRVRKRAFDHQQTAAGQETDFEGACRQAAARLGDGRAEIPHEAFGEFLAWSGRAVGLLADRLLPGSEAPRVHAQIEAMFHGGEVDQGAYEALERSLSKGAEQAAGKVAALEHVAQALELLDIALLVEKTQDVTDPDEMMIELARFFDATLNNHIFDCTPYHYDKERGAGFEGMGRQERFELAVRHHRWLYAHSRWLMAQRTCLSSLGPSYQDAWMGDMDRDLTALGLNVEDPAQRFWFGYARLRDVAVLVHEGFAPPEIFRGLDPDVLGCAQRANVAIVYPHGNTTVPVALEQGAKLAAQAGVNLMLTAWPHLVEDTRYGRKVLHVYDGLTYVSRDDYEAALKASGVEEESAAARARAVGDQGVLLCVEFSRPIVAEGIFFHFTHPLRPSISEAQAPLIQPLLWEAATHLKCLLPDMLRGSGVRTAAQINWYHRQTQGAPEQESKARIAEALTAFSEEHDTIIVKPEKESGGRKAMILPVRRDGTLIEGHISELTDQVYDICKTDNAVIQDVLKSRVRRLYTRAFLEAMVDRFAKIGVPVLLDRAPQTPLFSYFRQILILGEEGYEISHHITVVSTRGIANVGQGGLLYEYTDDIINPRYSEDLRREITKSARNSVASQRAYIKAHSREILDEYLAAHPEYAGQVRMEMGADLTGSADCDIPYEMGDYMPVFLVDDRDDLVRLYDEDTETFQELFEQDGSPTHVQVFDASGQPVARVDEHGHAVAIPLFDEEGARLPRFDAKGHPISTLAVLKIEPNPGAGLWRPHNDQLPKHRKGEGVFTIFECLGQRAKRYKEQLAQLARSDAGDRAPSSGDGRTTYLAGRA